MPRVPVQIGPAMRARRRRAGLGLVVLAVALGVGIGLARQPALSAQARGAAPAAAPVTLIRNATVLTVTRGVIQNGSILVRDGKIAAVGSNIAAPAGADIVDASGRFVTPGLIDCHSHLAADSINEGGTTVSSMTGIEDVFNPTDIDIWRDLAGGLTTANVLHGSANPIGGKNFVIKLRWGKPTAADFVFDGALPGIKFALGENPKDLRQFGQAGPLRYPITRPGVEFVIRDAFTRAKAYQRAWQDYDRRKKAGEDVIPPRRDLQLDPLVEVLDGRRLVHAHSYRADEILMLIRLAEEMGFKIATFQHVLEGYKVAKEIAAHGAGASTFSDWWGYKIEAEDAIPYNAALMTRKGVLVSINSDSAEHARRLNTEAAKSVKWGGLTDDEALALVTINPAKQLRIDRRVGSIEVGKDADLTIWTHHPLSSYAIVDRVYIDGAAYFDRPQDERRLTERAKQREALVAAERSTRRPAAPTESAAPPRTADRTPDDADASPNGHGGVEPAPRIAGRANAQSSTGQTAGASRTRTAVDAAPRGVLVITNARITPVSAPVIERGSVVIRDGRIEAVGANATAPAGARVIDAMGGEVYPGWINARSTVGLAEPGPRGFDDVNEMLDFNPQLRPDVAYQADSDAIPIARANGVTTAAITPAGGLLGGQVAVMNLDGWTWEESTVSASAGVSFAFPTGVARGPGGAVVGDRPFDDIARDQARRLDEAANLLEEARAYAKAPAATRRTDWVLESLIPVVERRQSLFVIADAERLIRDAVAFADRVGVNIVITGGLEAPLVAPLLAQKKIPVVLGSVFALPTRRDQWHAATYQAAGLLARAGVKVAFASADTTNARLIPYQAALSVAWGMPREEAIKALTINAAEILGVSDQLGSLEPGKMANVLVARGDPLEVRTTITHVIVNGREVSLDNKHLALYERFSKRQ